MNKDEFEDFFIKMNAYNYNIYKHVYTTEIKYPIWVQLITNYDNLTINERRDEFIKLMKDKNRVNIFKILDKYGILKRLIPEIEDMKGIKAGDNFHHPEKDVFIHTIAALSKLDRNASIELIFAIMLHDIGKPITALNRHFYDHAQAGAEMSEIILTRLKFDPEIIQNIKWLISQHMRIRKINEMREFKKIQLIEHPLFNELLRLLNADIMTNDKKILDDIEKIKNEYWRKTHGDTNLG